MLAIIAMCFNIFPTWYVDACKKKTNFYRAQLSTHSGSLQH